MAYEVVDKVPTKDDWRGTTWVVTLENAPYIPVGTTMQVEENLDVVITNGGVTGPPVPARWLESGQLVIEGTSHDERVTANGTVIPPGTPYWIVASMVTFEDAGSSPPDVQRHVGGLTLVDDPEDAGIIGADEG